jgi:hypothetical protein
MRQIQYSDGYKYQLEALFLLKTDIKPLENIHTHFIDLDTSGLLLIYEGFAWDGPSGPTLDTKNFMRGSLVHDALYCLMRNGLLDHDKWRIRADELLREICREDGMSYIRALFVFQAVKWFGDPFADPRSKRPLQTAP